MFQRLLSTLLLLPGLWSVLWLLWPLDRASLPAALLASLPAAALLASLPAAAGPAPPPWWTWSGPALTLLVVAAVPLPPAIPALAAVGVSVAAVHAAARTRPPRPRASAPPRAPPKAGARSTALDREQRVVMVTLRLLHDLRQLVRAMRTGESGQIDARADYLDRLATLAIRYLTERTPPTLERRPVRLDRLAHQAVADWSAAAQRVAVRMATMTAPVGVVGDRVAIRRVLDNLIANAVRAAAPGGTVTVRVDVAVTSAGVAAVLEVRDTGRGIPPDLLPRLFQPFAAAEGGGAGLGLAIVADLVEAMDGVVAVDSVAGVGAAVTVQLPAVDLDATLLPEEEEPEEPEGDAPRRPNDNRHNRDSRPSDDAGAWPPVGELPPAVSPGEAADGWRMAPRHSGDPAS